MQRGAFTTALNCSGRQHGIEKGRTKKGTSASRLRGQIAFLIMSACRLSGGAPYYPRDFGPSPERSLAAFVSVGPPGCSQHAVSLVLGCSPCSSGTHGMYFSTYMPWPMPPRHAAMRTPQRTCPPRTLGRGRLAAAGHCRAFSEPRAQAEPSARDRAQPAGAGVEGRGVGVARRAGRLWFDGMRGMRALGERGAARSMFSSRPLRLRRPSLSLLITYSITLLR